MTLHAGRPATVKMELGPIRELVRDDLKELLEKRPVVQLQSIRDNHHRIARAVASGLPNTTIATLCGISVNRVSILKQDPAFNDLVAHYRGMLTAEWTEQIDTVTEFLGSVRTKSLAMLEDKLCAAEENGEFLPTRELVSMAELGLDRTGYGKQSKTFNVNADFASLLEAARQRSGRAQASPPLSPIVDSSRVPQSALVLEHAAPQAEPAPPQFRRRV